MTERALIYAGWALWDDRPRVSFSTQAHGATVQVTARSSKTITLTPGWLLADARLASARLAKWQRERDPLAHAARA